MKRAGSYNKNVCAIFIAVSLVCLLMSASAYASTDRFSDIPLKMKMTTDIPESILTPDAVQTRLGTLEFFDGYPSADTVEIVYENLMFMRGIQTFLNCVPIASMEAMRAGMHDVGAVDGTVGIFEDLMDSKSLFLTANTESIYAVTWLDLENGPIVVESPPDVL